MKNFFCQNNVSVTAVLLTRGRLCTVALEWSLFW